MENLVCALMSMVLVTTETTIGDITQTTKTATMTEATIPVLIMEKMDTTMAMDHHHPRM